LTASAPLAARRLPPSFKVGEAESILWELQQVPRPGPFSFQALPVISGPPDTFLPSKYEPDHGSLADAKARTGYDSSRHPLRAAIFTTLRAMHEHQMLSLRGKLYGPKVDLKGKQQILREQQDLGAAIFHLEEVRKKMAQAAKDRSKEKSPRWQAHYDYVQAALDARLVFCYEFNFLLSRIRADALPPLAPGHSGWRVAADRDLRITEAKVHNLHDDMRRTLKKLQTDHPGTPWALLAEAEARLERGLVWLPYRE
jgi:hypothetical protein